MMIETTELNILIPVLVTLSFIQGLSHVRKQNLLCQFSQKIPKWLVATTCWFFKLKLNFFNVINFEGEDSTYVIL